MHQTPFTPNTSFSMSDQGFPQPSPFGGGAGMPPPSPGGAIPPPGGFPGPAQGPYPGAVPGSIPPPSSGWSDAGGGGGGGNWQMSNNSGGGGKRTAIILIVILVLTGLSTAAWLITRNDAQNAADDARDQADDILATLPEITIPEITIPEITIPEITIPVITVPQIETTVVPVETAPVETVPVTTAPPVVLPDINLFTGTQAGEMIAEIAAARAAAPLRILQVAIYPTYSFAQVQDPTIPANVDEFPWRDGSVGVSSPVQLVGGGELEPNLFSDTDVNWAAIPTLVEQAKAALAIEEGEVSHVIVQRNLPFTPDVVIRVYVSGPRSSGFIEADAQGNVTAVRPS